MENNININTIKTFLDNYGWKYKENDGFLYSVFLTDDNESVIIKFRAEGEFVFAYTMYLLRNVDKVEAYKLLELNDTLKLVKIFAFPEETTENSINLEVGFELWNKSVTSDVFESFLDMLCYSIQRTLRFVREQGIYFETDARKQDS